MPDSIDLLGLGHARLGRYQHHWVSTTGCLVSTALALYTSPNTVVCGSRLYSQITNESLLLSYFGKNWKQLVIYSALPNTSASLFGWRFIKCIWLNSGWCLTEAVFLKHFFYLWKKENWTEASILREKRERKWSGPWASFEDFASQSSLLDFRLTCPDLDLISRLCQTLLLWPGHSPSSRWLGSPSSAGLVLPSVIRPLLCLFAVVYKVQ